MRAEASLRLDFGACPDWSGLLFGLSKKVSKEFKSCASKRRASKNGLWWNTNKAPVCLCVPLRSVIGCGEGYFSLNESDNEFRFSPSVEISGIVSSHADGH